MGTYQGHYIYRNSTALVAINAAILAAREPGAASPKPGQPRGRSRGSARPAGTLAPCGTTAAAQRHYRRGEPLDTACRTALRQDQAGRRARRAS